MGKLVFCVFLLFLVASALAHDVNKEHEKNKGKHHGKHHRCHYKNTVGEDYDLRMLEKALEKQDWKVYNTISKSTFHLNPCGNVIAEGCPEGSSVCEITEKNEAVSYGTAESAAFADGHDGNSIEIAFGNGELCNNGAPRKAIVDFKCALSQQPGPFRTQVTHINEEQCLVMIEVESPHACPVNVFCSSIQEAHTCSNTMHLCSWSNNQCHKAQPNFLRKWAMHHGLSMTAFVGLLSLSAFFVSCFMSICCCALCRRIKNRRLKKQSLPVKAPKKSKKNIEKKVEAEEKHDENAMPMMEFQPQPFVYQPLQQLQDIYSGQVAQGYVIQFVPATPSVQQE